MKQYLVFMADLSIVPLQGQNPFGGRIERFEDFDEALNLAESQKNDFDLIFVYRAVDERKMIKLAHFQKGKNFMDSLKKIISISQHENLK